MRRRLRLLSGGRPAPSGRFCFCFPFRDRRARLALAEAGLVPLSVQPVIFRQGRPPHLGLYVCGREGATRDHSHGGVLRDFRIIRAYPHRFLAFHDIRGGRASTRGVRTSWDRLGEGYRLELVRPHRELGLEASLMGIGVWSADEDPAG